VTNNLHSYHAYYVDWINAVWVSPQDPDEVLVGSTKGIFKSSNGGDTWSQTSVTDPVEDFTFFPAIDTVYAATTDSGVYKSEDRGATWEAFNNDLDIMRCDGLDMDATHGILYLGTNGGSVWRNEITWPILAANVHKVPEATGGAVDLTLTAGVTNANRNYLIVGGTSGTSPGLPLPGGSATLPINWDGFSHLEMSLLNTYPFLNFLGSLDGQGKAYAQFNVPPLPGGCAGVKFYFAFCLNSPFDFTSNPVTIEIVP
jgi:hypothetical protein